MQSAAKRKSLSPVSVDGSAVPGGSAPAGLPCGSLSRRLPHASAGAVRVLLLLVVTLCLGQTRVWGFGITSPSASGVFESVTPSSIGENTIAWQYDASDSPHAARTELTVIGHLKPPTGPGYVEVAESLGANYLKPSASWNWQKQGDFIKSVIQRGDDVLIGTPIRPGDSVLRHEIKQLIKAGYVPAEQGSKLLIKTAP